MFNTGQVCLIYLFCLILQYDQAQADMAPPPVSCCFLRAYTNTNLIYCKKQKQLYKEININNKSLL